MAALLSLASNYCCSSAISCLKLRLSSKTCMRRRTSSNDCFMPLKIWLAIYLLSELAAVSLNSSLLSSIWASSI